MNNDCAPFQRKSLYLLLTIPMMVLYIVVALFLWHASLFAFVAYCACFPIVAIGQSYACVYWRCPYVGKFAPCAGGFCLPSSQIARVLKNTRRSEAIYNVAVSVAGLALLGIIFVPVWFLYQQGIAHLLIYLGIVVVYAASFLWLICPVCATRHACPGGQVAMKMRRAITGK
ncbi:MAG: hypothetical protein JXA93_23965 [Anaerolineae bacterium]|nr:hypothetical protein [Anaerolineae bacterium]